MRSVAAFPFQLNNMHMYYYNMFGVKVAETLQTKGD